MRLWTAGLLVFLLNLPFGYWRASVKRFSPLWFVAVLLPAALVLALGVSWGFGRKPVGSAVLVGLLLLGQFAGGKVRHLISGRGPGRAKH